jgi:hypothetical protein
MAHFQSYQYDDNLQEVYHDMIRQFNIFVLFHKGGIREKYEEISNSSFNDYPVNQHDSQ